MASQKTTESVNYYLKHGTGYANHNIYLQFKFDGHRLRYYLQQSVDPKRWNVKKQRVKDADARTADGRYRINDLLNTLAQVCIDAYYQEAANGAPTPGVIKPHLDRFINQHHNTETINAARPTFMELVDRFVAGDIKIMQGEKRGTEKTQSTLKNYQTTKGHLLGYQAKRKVVLDFDSITLDWYMKFTSYLKAEGLSPNSIGKEIKNVKAIMQLANKLTFEIDGTRYPYTTNKDYLEFAVHKKAGDDPYLTEAEISTFYRFDLSHNRKLEAVRDLFVFGCMVGLRYSDYSNVKPHNIIEQDGEKFIYIKTKKTRGVVYIPCNPVVLEIFDKYKKTSNNLPRTISGQKFNEYLKDAAKQAGLTELGRKPSEPEKPLHDCVSSHTARRSFATNYYLDGFPTIDLMKITDHSTEKSFLNYIRVTELQAAKRMAEHNRRKNWTLLLGGLQEQTLKAV